MKPRIVLPDGTPAPTQKPTVADLNDGLPAGELPLFDAMPMGCLLRQFVLSIPLPSQAINIVRGWVKRGDASPDVPTLTAAGILKPQPVATVRVGNNGNPPLVIAWAVTVCYGTMEVQT